MVSSADGYAYGVTLNMVVTVTVEHSTASQDFAFDVNILCPPQTIADQVLRSYEYIIGDTTPL